MEISKANIDLPNNKKANRKLALILTASNNMLLNIGILLLRFTLGGILFVVGSGKVFSWFGGYGLSATLSFYGKVGFAPPLAYLSIFTEFIGGFLLIVGFLTRPVAIAVMINMLVATIVMLPNGFIAQNGASYPFLFLIISIVVLISGPMALSIDAFVFKKNNIS